MLTSVIVLAFGEEPWLHESVASALASTDVEVEVVVVDNGSAPLPRGGAAIGAPPKPFARSSPWLHDQAVHGYQRWAEEGGPAPMPARSSRPPEPKARRPPASKSGRASPRGNTSPLQEQVAIDSVRLPSGR